MRRRCHPGEDCDIVKRHLRKLVLFVLLGAIVNVAVAWGCAWGVELGNESHVAMQGDVRGERFWFGVGHWSGFGSDRHEIMLSFGRHTQVKSQGMISARFSVHGDKTALHAVESPTWSRLGIAIGDDRRVIEAEDARGWPLRSMWGVVLEYDANEQAYVMDPESALYFPQGFNPNQWAMIGAANTYPVTVVPLGLIGPGFAINTVFYTAVLWLSLVAPGRLRRWRRVRRGLCAACGYPIGSSDNCTECGAAVMPSQSTGS